MMKKILFNTIIFFVMFFFPVHGLYAADETDEYINGMTLPEKIGQIMLIGFQDTTLSSRDINHIKKINPGGIIFYKRNFKNTSDIPSLIANIKSILQNNDLPLFFAIDQEGGIVQRIKGESYKPPSQPAIGAVNSEELARKVGKSVGSALRSLGINLNLAPVLDIPADIFSSPMTLRSFSNDPKTVEKLGIAYIEGGRDAGILPTAKHFPGLGRSREDSHHALPRITWKTQDEKNSDMLPFKGAIKAGVDIIMLGHFIAEPGDPKNPVSLSSYWMKDILRKELEFNGLIIVDNIEMKPIGDLMSISEAAVQSFKAGADIIMVSHERKKQEEVFNAFIEAVKKGDISNERLNESLRMIIMAKKKILSYKADKGLFNNLHEVSRLIEEHSITVLKLKDIASYTTNKDGTVLFVGNNLLLFNAARDYFRHTEILNTTLANYEKMNHKIPIVNFMKKFDAIIIDANYSDASRIIPICNDLNSKYFVFQIYLTNIQKIFEEIKPKHVVILLESDSIYLQGALDIISGLKQAKGNLPYSLVIPASYVLY